MSPSILLLFLSLFITPSFSAFVAPITKHHVHNTPFYTLKLQLKTPMQPTFLLLHIGATYTAVNCRHNYTSTTSRPVPCNSSLCHSLQSNQLISKKCDITTNTAVGGNCVISPHKSFALVDSLALPATDGRNPGKLTAFPEFVFTCSDESSRLLKGRAKKVVAGLAGLGVSNYSLPAQVSANSSVFSLCISGSPSAPGVAFFGLDKPYYFFPGLDVSNHLSYTPLFSYHGGIFTNQKTETKQLKDGYYIKVKSIIINGKPININQKLTMISTTNPYTVLERSIFRAVTVEFEKESRIMKLKSIKPVKPFKLCYEADGVLETHLGPTVPQIKLVMQNDVVWRVFGKNSMVRIVDEGLDAWCLAVVDGGVGSVPAIVIGGHQLEDNLLQFDYGKKRLGFSSTLLQYKTVCANFNFSTNNAIKVF
ncbi:putative aspartic peptidase A1 family, aspartic peptidase domain superfamily, xylanase inhibitor [Helianthus debilis subsp. tardiflorus]